MNDDLVKLALPADAEIITASGDPLIAAAEPQFRTVPTNGSRAGVRIEKVFWESLSDISEELGIKRSALASTVVKRAKAGRLNVASALRSYVAMVQRTENQRMRAALATARIARLQQLAPIPSFALNRQKRLIAANQEFVQLVKGVSDPAVPGASPEVAQLSLDRPIEDVFAELSREDASMRCMLTIRIDNRHRIAACKIVAVPPLPTQAIVGYVLGRPE